MKIGLIVISILFLGIVSATTLSQWPLTLNGSASNINSNVNAGDFIAGSEINGNVGEGVIIGNFAITSAGASATNWPTGALDSNSYYQISVSPKTGFNLNINSINFGQSRNNNGIKNYDVQWSKFADFSSPTTIAMVNVPLDDQGHIGDINGLNISVNNGETLYIRLFGYNANNLNGVWSIYKTAPNNGGINDTLSIGGSVTTITPPEPQPSLEDRVAVLEGKVTDLENKVDGLENRTTTLEKIVEKIVNIISNLPKGLIPTWFD
ncbi:MAG: hypothetical protein AABW51_02810 [Nanoarchaeota archaeon]